MMMKFLLVLLLLIAALPPAYGAEFTDDAFAQIPVQHEGRIKPLESFARIHLKSFSGAEHLGDKSAVQWMAMSLFDPGFGLNVPVFRVLKPQALGLPAKEGRLYSLAELSPLLQTRAESIAQLAAAPPQSWSDDQKELMRLHTNALIYMQILRSFSLLLPLPVPVPDILLSEWKHDSAKPFTMQTFAGYERRLQDRVAKIVKDKGDDPSLYSEEEQQIVFFSFQMETLRSGGDNNSYFRVIPSVWAGGAGEWFSPWAITQSGQASPETTALLDGWRDVATGWNAKDGEKFTKAAELLTQNTQAYIDRGRLAAEKTYTAFHPLGWAMMLYLAAFLAFAASRMSSRRGIYPAALGLLAGAAIAHTAAIALRVYILARPPVGTLYESILFVALICVLATFWIERRRRDGTGIMIGALSGGLLLFLSEAFAGEDTLTNLVAVLNTNFWLATHVLCITIGYGICLIASMLAHLQLFHDARKGGPAPYMGAIRTTGLLALLFTTIGTILGGIWADQSWGRFWGWDPKENGALLIVLWLAWIYHGQIGGHLPRTAFTAAMAALSIVVALAWFGVNLLNVGLHSYGFISGVAGGLIAFCLLELGIIGLLWRKAALK